MNYELSLWKYISHVIPDTDHPGSNLNEYLREKKCGLLASSTMTSPIAGYDLSFQEKINGERSLTFTMNARYWDIQDKVYRDNPYTTTIAGQTQALLNNGTILKLKTDNGVYSFVIDSIDKNSEKMTYTYTCSNADYAQLAKTGYNVELNTDLENNMGTVFELANTIIDGIDWVVVDDKTAVTLSTGEQIKSNTIKAENIEALYSYTLTNALTNVTNMTTGATALTIPANSVIYICSSSYLKQSNTIQFMYVVGNNVSLNEQLLITNSDNYTSALPSEWSGVWPDLTVNTVYRGAMLAAANIVKYIPQLDQICTEYTKTVGGVTTDYYGFTKTEYLNSTSIQEIIGNNTNIIDIDDWTRTIIDTAIVSKTEGETPYEEALDYAKSEYYTYNGTTGILHNIECTTVNSCKGMFENSSGFSKSIPFYFCYKPYCAPSGESTEPIIYPTEVGIYARSNNTSNDADFKRYHFSTTATTLTELPGYVVYKLELTGDQLSYTDITNSYIKLVLTFATPTITTQNGYFKFSDVKFFEEAKDKDENIIIPNLTQILSSIIQEKYYFVEQNKITDEVTSIYDVAYSDICYANNSAYANYIPKTNTEDYALITSIEAKESNRFNLIQELCEKFECWAKLVVDTDSSGETLYKYNALTANDKFVSGKQYYVVNGIPSGGYFDDEHFKYAIISNLFNSEVSYKYNRKDYYYTLVNGMYIKADLGHQWKEVYLSGGNWLQRYYYTLTYVTNEGIVDKVWTKHDPTTETYQASVTYYIMVSGSDAALTEAIFEEVTVGNEFDGLGTYVVLKDTWYTNLYKKDYAKYITFNEYTGNKNLIGFKYGINLGTITRNLDSTSLVTKLIVADNTNEYADNGYCSIIDSVKNVMGANTIYNFSYYINTGAISEAQYLRDMYGSNNTTDLAYTTKYREINLQSQANITELTELTTALVKLNSKYQTYNAYVTQSETSWSEYVTDIQDALKDINITRSWEDCANPTITYYDEEEYSELINSYIKKRDVCKEQKTRYEQTTNNLQAEVTKYSERLRILNTEQSNFAKYKAALDYEFYSRYKNFIREGTWSSDDYYDPDKYYLDAGDVLLQSSVPKVSYTFKVVDLSDLNGWGVYKFGIGDKTFVKDAEFFKDQDNAQMDVIISEINWQLDKPWDTQVTVQNYTTEFQDLFSKITAATQNLEYKEARYDKAGVLATDVEEGGYLLSNILSSNLNIISEADGKFTYDTTGITAIDANTKYQLKLTGRGLVLSKDGGATWSTGISGQGINAEVITTGKLNVDNITIYGGKSNKQFEWDSYGINAYTQGAVGSNLTKYVRFCKYGIYGSTGLAYNTVFPSSEDILNSQFVNFGLTWDGLVLRSKRAGTGTITSTYCKIDANLTNGDQESVGVQDYTKFTGSVFEPDVTYYEYNSTNKWYFKTSDTSPQEGKNYYTRSDITKTLKKVITVGESKTISGNIVDTDHFIVYEDGTLKANHGIFTGIIKCDDLVNKSGISMLTGNDTISHAYLDLGGIIIDGNNSLLKLKATNGSSSTSLIEITNESISLKSTVENSPSINLTNSSLSLRGALVHIYNYSNEATGYGRICFHNKYDPTGETQDIPYGYVGAGLAVDPSVSGADETGIVVSASDKASYSIGTEPYVMVNKTNIIIRRGDAYLAIRQGGVYFKHANSANEELIGAGAGTTTNIAVFG